MLLINYILINLIFILFYKELYNSILLSENMYIIICIHFSNHVFINFKNVLPNYISINVYLYAVESDSLMF